MAMNLKFDGGDTEYEVVPKGEHKAICYRVVDAGTAEEKYEGELSNKHRIFLFWELPELKMEDGRPMSIFAGYTASLRENSNLYKISMSWMNRGFTEEEKQGFDPSIFVGKGCKLAVTHNANGNAKVNAVLTAPSAFDENEQLKNFATKNEQCVFDLEDYCNEFSGKSDEASKRACDIFEQLPRFIQHRIAGCDEVGREPVPPCFEMQAAMKRGGSIEAPPAKLIPDLPEDDIPF